MGGASEKLQQHLASMPDEQKYAAVRDYFNSPGVESSFVDEAYTLLTSPALEYLDSPVIEPGDELIIMISQTINAETKTLWRTTVSPLSEPVTTIVLSSE